MVRVGTLVCRDMSTRHRGTRRDEYVYDLGGVRMTEKYPDMSCMGVGGEEGHGWLGMGVDG
jgi:hypothetical protein